MVYMDMAALYELQAMQARLDILRERISGLHSGKELERLKEEYQRLREELTKGEEKIRKNDLQQEIKNNEIKNIQFNKKSCEDIKFSRETDTVKKLESIEKQLEKLDDKKREAENDIIKSIEEAENIKNSLVETKKKLNFIKKKYMSSKEESEKQAKEDSAEIEKLESAVSEVMGKVDKESLDIYEKVRRAHKDPVAVVEDRRCGGCNFEVPAMDFEALKSGSTGLRCQNCGRLLYKLRKG
jgi:predicted  nucleic acid-binding Zn-ribbon protein